MRWPKFFYRELKDYEWIIIENLWTRLTAVVSRKRKRMCVGELIKNVGLKKEKLVRLPIDSPYDLIRGIIRWKGKYWLIIYYEDDLYALYRILDQKEIEKRLIKVLT